MYRTGRGFTIVELLIVIVVIAILAAITIVAFNGIQDRARSASVQSDVSQSMKAIKSFAVSNADTYPTTISSCPSPVAGSLCVAEGSQNGKTYAVDNTASPRSFCVSFEIDDIRYYSDEYNQVLPGSCELRSCYQIQQAGGSRGSGTYWIRPTGAPTAMRVYCDMVTSGGGWTLLLTNPGPYTAWNATNVLSVNSTRPSISQQYSILNLADSIKSDLSGNLNYRLDAIALGRWGGVWQAPYANTFTGTTPIENASNLEQYDQGSWTIDTTLNDTNSLTNVMPYISSTRLLTTWGGLGSWWGTIATSSSGFTPAPYITSSPAANPGIIWYSVR